MVRDNIINTEKTNIKRNTTVKPVINCNPFGPNCLRNDSVNNSVRSKFIFVGSVSKSTDIPLFVSEGFIFCRRSRRRYGVNSNRPSAFIVVVVVAAAAIVVVTRYLSNSESSANNNTVRFNHGCLTVRSYICISLFINPFFDNKSRISEKKNTTITNI